MTEKILVIDDEIQLLEVVRDYLQQEGYDVYTSYNGNEGLKLFHLINPDFIVLDLMLPDLTGEEICKKIREESQVPIIMLTAKAEEDDKINGLMSGADDYMTKPFSPRELVARIKTVSRRVGNIGNHDILSFREGDLEIDNTEHVVKKALKLVSLTPNEYKLLYMLACSPNRVYSRSQLIQSALGFDYIGYDRTIDTHIKNLRQKIEDNPKEPVYIQTVYGIGYKFLGDKL